MTQSESREEFVRLSVERFEKPLVSYAYHMMGDLDRARDIVQETFMRLCKRKPAEVCDTLAPWLYTVCRNLALDTKRKEARMKRMNESEMELFAGNTPPPSAALENREDSGKVRALIETLPPNQKEAIWLKFRQGLKYREIAEVMGLSATNVGFLIHRGINQVREKMASPGTVPGKEVRHEDG